MIVTRQQPSGSNAPQPSNPIPIITAKGRSKDDDVDEEDKYIVDRIWNQQRRWELVATNKRNQVMFYRTAVINLAVLGASIQTLASQLPSLGSILSSGGGVILALIPIITSRYLGQENVDLRVTSRCLAEGLKSELYMYHAHAGPYSEVGRGATLLKRSKELQQKLCGNNQKLMRPFALKEVDKFHPPTVPKGTDYKTWYRTQRVKKEVERFHGEASFLSRQETRLRTMEYALSSAASLIGVLVGAVGSNKGAVTTSLGQFIKSKVGVWVAVVTTASTAIGTQIQATKVSELIPEKIATKNHLQDLNMLYGKGPGVDPSEGDWNRFVQNCENIMTSEVMKWAEIKRADITSDAVYTFNF